MVSCEGPGYGSMRVTLEFDMSIDVCMATYNGEKCVFFQLPSILEQLIVDDASWQDVRATSGQPISGLS